MTAQEFITLMAQLSGLVFVVGSMLAMGLSFTVAQITQPLKNVRLVILVTALNFSGTMRLPYILAGSIILPAQASSPPAG